MSASKFVQFILLTLVLLTAPLAHGDEIKNGLVIQVSADDPRTQTIALNIAFNLQKLYGVDEATARVARISELQQQEYTQIRP